MHFVSSARRDKNSSGLHCGHVLHESQLLLKYKVFILPLNCIDLDYPCSTVLTLNAHII